MKESFEDKITKRIKEVLDQYEPDYSPQAWEKLRKQIPVPEFWLKKLFLKYRFWFAGTAIIGGLFFAYQIFKPDESNKEVVFEIPDYRPINLLESRKPEAGISTEKPAIPYPEDSSSISGNQNHIISSGFSTVNLVKSQKNVYYEITQTDSISDNNIEIYKDFLINKVPEKKLHFWIPNEYTQLIKIEFQGAENIFVPEKSAKNKRKWQFQMPELGSIFKTGESYKKFVGPSKLAVFYSPEIHFVDDLKCISVSQGFGIKFEGSVRSNISMSVGLLYQSNSFNKTIFSIKVPRDSLISTIYVDSIGIRSGNYKLIEIPLSINLKVFESVKSHFWLGAGFSSVAFLKQSYTSETIVGGISEKVITKTKAWKNIYPLGSLNFNLTYDYKLSERLYMQGCIQYKYHLTTMGNNSMKLNRLNLQIGLLYRFGHEE